MGFQKSDADPNLYFILVGDDPLILVLYLDDSFIIGEDSLIQHCKRDLASEFDMTDMGLMDYFLGLEVWQEDGHIFVGRAGMQEISCGDSVWMVAGLWLLLWSPTGRSFMMLIQSC